MQRVWLGRTLVPQSETCTLGDSGENFDQKPLSVVAFTSSFIGVWIFKELHRGHVTAYFKRQIALEISRRSLSKEIILLI